MLLVWHVTGIWLHSICLVNTTFSVERSTITSQPEAASMRLAFCRQESLWILACICDIFYFIKTHP